MIHSVRMLSAPQAQRVTVNNISYVPGPSTAIDVPYPDNVELLNNGWLYVCPSGTRETRPRKVGFSHPFDRLLAVDTNGRLDEVFMASDQPGDYLSLPGAPFYCTTTKQMIWWDGAAWRNAGGQEV